MMVQGDEGHHLYLKMQLPSNSMARKGAIRQQLVEGALKLSWWAMIQLSWHSQMETSVDCHPFVQLLPTSKFLLIQKECLQTNIALFRDTVMTTDENMTKEDVMETLIAHKQIISNIKTQTWPMHRKLKVRFALHKFNAQFTWGHFVLKYKDTIALIRAIACLFRLMLYL